MRNKLIAPSFVLFVGIVCEIVIQFLKRSVYWLDTSASSIHYAVLFVGDAVFLSLFVIMLSRLRFSTKHRFVVFLFFVLAIYSLALNGLAPTLVSIRNTYIWFFAAILSCLSLEQSDSGGGASLSEPVFLLGLFLLAYSVFQVLSDFCFERPWFEYSGTSLSYDGITNFGQAAKAFSFMSGPTDFSVFGLFALAIGWSSRNIAVAIIGGLIIFLSGTRGVLIAIPAWMILYRASPRNVHINYLLSVGLFFFVILIFAEELISYLYAMPNSRFSLATLAPRIELWKDLDPLSLVLGEGFAINISSESLGGPPKVIDSGIIYLLSEVGAIMTFGAFFVFLTAIRGDALKYQRSGLMFFIGVLLVASIAQIPFHTRLSNFLICLLVYARLYSARIS